MNAQEFVNAAGRKLIMRIVDLEEIPTHLQKLMISKIFDIMIDTEQLPDNEEFDAYDIISKMKDIFKDTRDRYAAEKRELLEEFNKNFK